MRRIEPSWTARSGPGEPPPGQRPGEGEVIGRAVDGSEIPRYHVGHPTTIGFADGNAEAMALYAGQSVGLARERRPAAEIVRDLVAEAERTLASIAT